MVRSKGFSLAELAVVMVIVGLLLAGALIPFSAQIDLKNVADTQRTMDSIREAIIGFAQANGRLPCAADGTKPSGSAGAGTELYTPPPGSAQCSTVPPLGLAGVVPWATLGVPETDGWGRRFSYYVVQEFADDNSKNTWQTALQNPACTPPTNAPLPSAPTSFALCTLGNLIVNTRDDTTHLSFPVGSSLAAVIISHGKNGRGAYQPSGILMPAPVGLDETRNASRPPVLNTFFNRPPTPSASVCDDTAAGPFCEFDDLVVMITSNLLIARMVSAGRLP